VKRTIRGFLSFFILFVGSLYRLNCPVILPEFQGSAFLHHIEAVLCHLVFSRVFLFSFKGKWPTHNEDSTAEKQREQESTTLIAVLNSMKASIDSGNSLLQELVSHKRSSPDNETKTSKRRESYTALQKANATSSDEDENNASEKANTQHHHDASEADALSLFGGGDIDEIQDTVLEDREDGD